MFDLPTDTSQQIEEAWNKSQNIKKTEFALEYAIDKSEWIVPKYISEGIKWLVDSIPLPRGAKTASKTSEKVKIAKKLEK